MSGLWFGYDAGMHVAYMRLCKGRAEAMERLSRNSACSYTQNAEQQARIHRPLLYTIVVRYHRWAVSEIRGVVSLSTPTSLSTLADTRGTSSSDSVLFYATVY